MRKAVQTLSLVKFVYQNTTLEKTSEKDLLLKINLNLRTEVDGVMFLNTKGLSLNESFEDIYHDAVIHKLVGNKKELEIDLKLAFEILKKINEINSKPYVEHFTKPLTNAKN